MAVNNDGREFSQTEDRMYGRAGVPHQPQPERYPQPAYPGTYLSEFETRMEADQRRANKGIQDQNDLSLQQTRPGEMSHVDLARFRKHDSFLDMAGARTPFPAENQGFRTYQYRPQTSQSVRPMREDTPSSEFLARRAAYMYPSTPNLDGTSLYRPPLMEGQQHTYLPPTTRQQGVQRAMSLSHRVQSSPYSPYAGDFTPTPDRSTIGSPIPRPSPDSLLRELEATKEYSERMLTKLVETEQLLEDGNAENARLHARLAALSLGEGPRQRDGAQDRENENLRRELHDRGQMLTAALDDLARAQRQTEKYSQECLRLRESQTLIRQQAQPEVVSGPSEEAQKVIDFYRKKVDRLSKENMDISRQNRKLTEDLAVAQKRAP